MKNDYKNIYFNHADKYEQLVEKEDYEKNLLKTLLEITSFDNKHVIEFGAGTGRLTRQIATLCSRIRAFDFAPAMIAVAAQKLALDGLKNWEVGVADNENIPAESTSCDISIAGWSFGHMTSWEPDNWKTRIQNAVNEMKRVTKKDGALIIIETQGTGYETPFEPTGNLKSYFEMLNDLGFSFRWIRTDYKFNSIEEGQALTSFFFGKSFDLKKTILPECTGIWFKSN